MKKRNNGDTSSFQEEHSLLHDICQALVDKKGKNIVVIDVRDATDFTDYFIIAEGTVDRHVQALSREVETILEKRGKTPFGVEGIVEGMWIVLDYSEVVVHIFTHEMRMRYSLEEVWKEGSLVQIPVEYTVEKEKYV